MNTILSGNRRWFFRILLEVSDPSRCTKGSRPRGTRFIQRNIVKSWLRCETKTSLAINILEYQTYIDSIRDILLRKREKSKIKGNSKLLWTNSWLNLINVAKIGEKRISGIIGFWLRMNSCWAGIKNLFFINVGPLSNADLIFCKVSLLFPS